MSQGVKKFKLFSDNCPEQNRNKGIMAVYWHAINSMDIDEIVHIVLEKGHTQNPNDSIHSVIERASRYMYMINGTPS